MRILHVITRMILGGAQENTLLSVLGQTELGHEVRLCSGPTTGPEGSLVREAREKGVDFAECPELLREISPLNDLRTERRLRRLIRDYRPDVVHTHSSKAGVLGRMAAWAERVPAVVHTIHGLPFHPYQGKAAHFLYVQAERFAARRCHRIVCVADAMAEQAAAAGVAPRAKFLTVYSGMDTAPFLDDARDRDAIRARYGFSPQDFVIGKVARLFELKGHEFLFAAFGRLAREFPQAKLLLVGDGLLRGEFERQVAAAGWGERVRFAGLVPHQQVPEAIWAMDLLAHCSLREGLARVLPQALLSGVPVASFDIDGAREVVVNGKTGFLVPPGDVAGLESAIRAALADYPAAKRLALAGRELCRERFDWRKMCRVLLDLYESLR